ncbi:cobyric acid synthase [Planococcus lenghuensis]|uniref:Cobyric acid synthase n=1 Tax=Planococcus lenghuensis TaxID=2213202 RepID=A0A1Q2L1M1_9BACL|nr:cobyric acid synthase [Planococcus lenghuensis]AQQ54313.1 cobyric acid synthase CobQ [Planococcus lenghuensis]
MKGIMIQGTSSDVGKSMICTALCRILSDEGKQVAPFKSQNMSNNSYVTVLGEEIGRAQGVQAEAARTVATVNMNPILLKPESDMRSQVILFGKKRQAMDGMAYRTDFYEEGLTAIDRALQALGQTYSHIVIEGAGSPAEVNLNDRELVNMSVAERADVSVILVADIERGGVFASIVGTLALMPNPERVKGLLINKFRGDIRLFEDGVAFLESYTGIPVLGVIPYSPDHGIEQEDSLGVSSVRSSSESRPIDLAVLHHPYLSNFTDLEPLLQEPDVAVRWVRTTREIGKPDVLVLPGTKSTIADLRHWKQQGLAAMLKDLSPDTLIIGLCGGFQMMGASLKDPEGFDGLPAADEAGFGLIPGMETRFSADKYVKRRSGKALFPTGLVDVEGYEIHTGVSSKTEAPFIIYDGAAEGYWREGIIGTHLHGLFDRPDCRRAFLAPIRKRKGLSEPPAVDPVDRYDLWAEHVKSHIDWQAVSQMMEEES